MGKLRSDPSIDRIVTETVCEKIYANREYAGCLEDDELCDYCYWLESDEDNRSGEYTEQEYNEWLLGKGAGNGA